MNWPQSQLITNFINTKTNNLPNNSNDFLPRTYRNTDSSIVAKKNYNVNTTNSINNNKVYIKKRKEGNPRHKSSNKTDINNPPENFNNYNINNKKKVMSKIDVHGQRRPTSNSIRMQNSSNNFQEKKNIKNS